MKVKIFSGIVFYKSSSFVIISLKPQKKMDKKYLKYLDINFDFQILIICIYLSCRVIISAWNV